MTISLETLSKQSNLTGFRAEMLEKTLRLIELLSMLMDQFFLKNKLVLKGGTALNLFHFGLPRLSIDIDLNYIGTANREEMLIERKQIEELLFNFFQREGYSIRRNPTEHIGGKISLRYISATGQTALLEIDLNYMLRVPLWPVVQQDSMPIGLHQAKAIPTLDIHELMAGKLSALFSRHASRDLFDTHYFFKHYDKPIDKQRLRLAFIVYGAINRKDWRTICIDDITFTESEIRDQLIPVLSSHLIRNIKSSSQWANKIVNECREALIEQLLPLQENEIEFLNQLNDHGQVCANLLTTDNDLIQKINANPGIQWKAYNVAKFKKLHSPQKQAMEKTYE